MADDKYEEYRSEVGDEEVARLRGEKSRCMMKWLLI